MTLLIRLLFGKDAALAAKLVKGVDLNRNKLPTEEELRALDLLDSLSHEAWEKTLFHRREVTDEIGSVTEVPTMRGRWLLFKRWVINHAHWQKVSFWKLVRRRIELEEQFEAVKKEDQPRVEELFKQIDRELDYFKVYPTKGDVGEMNGKLVDAYVRMKPRASM